MTRHWVEANLDEYGAGFELICEHPQTCGETSEEVRSLGCCVKDFFDDMGTDLFEIAKGVKVPLGKIEVGLLWQGSDEDAELRLIPIDSPAGAPEGSRQPSPAGETEPLHLLQWNHPQLGRVAEFICQTHESEMLAALKLLGIGCLGEFAREDPQAACARCAHAGVRASTWLPAMTSPRQSQPDWRRIAVQIARYGGSYYGLKTWERDALEAEVKAENERDWGTDHERTADAAERGEDA